MHIPIPIPIRPGCGPMRVHGHSPILLTPSLPAAGVAG
jgi:hypothetical protein